MQYYYDLFGHIYIKIDEMYYAIFINDETLELIKIEKQIEYQGNMKKYNIKPVDSKSTNFDEYYTFEDDKMFNILNTSKESNEAIPSFNLLLFGDEKLMKIDSSLSPDCMYNTYYFMYNTRIKKYIISNVLKSPHNCIYQLVLYDNNNFVKLHIVNYKSIVFEIDTITKQCIFNHAVDL
jgi:hypothetical protein